MDRKVVAEKLESLRRCVERIEEKRPSSLEIMLNDIDTQDIIVLNLTRAIQLCVDIGAHIIANSKETPPATMGETFDKLLTMDMIDDETASNMKKAIGFRNIAIHGYSDIDFTIVYSIINENLRHFQDFAKTISLEFISKK